MICLSIANVSLKKCISLLKNVECAEIRLDKLELTDEGIRKIFVSHKNLIATNRRKTENENRDDQTKRINEIKTAIEAGAKFVDLDLDEEETLKHEAINLAKEYGTKIIISYHNFKITPTDTELDEIIKKCQNTNADIVKIATNANSKKDSARLLGLLGRYDNLIVVGMGKEGMITRIVGPMLGSHITFASIGKDNSTAPGQVEYKKLKKIISQIGDLE